ncbi:MAG: hypothetical protein AAF242_06265, partial [Bacteroidota bacterium]
LFRSEMIDFKCSNRYDPEKVSAKGANGLGNKLIAKRLQLLYPDRHELKVNHRKELYEVELSIQHESI